MKISNSKKELARIISENGGWRDDAKWSVQHKTDGRVVFTKSKYKPEFSYGCWDGFGTFYGGFVTQKALPNWHQCILSREEYFHLYPVPDVDGWIEWNGGECPVDKGCMVVCKIRSGREWRDGKAIKAEVLRWHHSGSITDIIAYRLHKPEQQLGELCDKVTEENKHEHVDCKPTIEQLTADYRNRKDYADRKQEEADAANAEAKAKLTELVAAGNAIGLVISVAEKEPELVITRWQDLQVGDEIEVVKSKSHTHEGKVGVVYSFDKTDDLQPVRVIFGGNRLCYDWPTEWRFIRRPTK